MVRTSAALCAPMQPSDALCRLQPFAHLCSPMRTSAVIYSPMQAYAGCSPMQTLCNQVRNNKGTTNPA